MAAPALRLLPDPPLLRHDLRALRSRLWDVATSALLDDLAVGPDARILHLGPAAAGEPPDVSGAYDVVHARFQLALHGRPRERVDGLRDLVAPGGILLLEEPDARSLVFEPYAPAASHLVGRVAQVLRAAGGDLDAGRQLPAHLRRAGLTANVRTHVVGLEAGHPGLQLPLDLADAFSERLADVLGNDGLAQLRRRAAEELAQPERRGTTLTLVQAWARVA